LVALVGRRRGELPSPELLLLHRQGVFWCTDKWDQLCSCSCLLDISYTKLLYSPSSKLTLLLLRVRTKCGACVLSSRLQISISVKQGAFQATVWNSGSFHGLRVAERKADGRLLCPVGRQLPGPEAEASRRSDRAHRSRMATWQGMMPGSEGRQAVSAPDAEIPRRTAAGGRWWWWVVVASSGAAPRPCVPPTRFIRCGVSEPNCCCLIFSLTPA
jgi:hypothetical protein